MAVAAAAPLIAREAFYAAMEDGNTATLDAYFAQPHVLAEVDVAEAFIAADDSTDISFGGRPPDFDTVYYPWYWTQPTLDSGQMEEFLFARCVQQDRVEVIQWFFSPARVSHMRATLTRLLPFVARLIMRCNNVEMLDCLLSSKTFKLLLPDAPNAQSLLNELASSLCTSCTEDVIQILLAHGSDVNAHQWRHACFESLNESQIHIVVLEGMVVVGAAVVSNVPVVVDGAIVKSVPDATTKEGARRLLRLGGDANGKTCMHPLHRAARYCEPYLAHLLLEEAFVDVDARDSRGCTPLMVVSAGDNEMDSSFSIGPSLIACMLLERGADVALRDDNGRTALHHAIGTENSEIVKMLLDHKALHMDTF